MPRPRPRYRPSGGRSCAKWRLKCKAVADSFEKAGGQLFTFLGHPDCRWRSLCTTNAIERLNEEFRRRIQIPCMLPCAESVCMLFRALLASGQITLRKVDGWQTGNIGRVGTLVDTVKCAGN